MSLAFLRPPAPVPAAMLARSPVERAAIAAGATLEQLAGWNVPGAFDGPEAEAARLRDTVGFADRCSLAKLEIQASPDELAAIVARAGNVEVPQPGSAAHARGTWWCRITPQRALVLSEREQGADVAAAVGLAAMQASATASVIDCTCGLAALAIVGPNAHELLARFCAIDVRPAHARPGSFRPGSVARTPGYVLVEGERRLLTLVGWALGEYLWGVVADAAPRLGGGPVGLRALRAHPEASDA